MVNNYLGWSFDFVLSIDGVLDFRFFVCEVDVMWFIF